MTEQRVSEGSLRYYIKTRHPEDDAALMARELIALRADLAQRGESGAVAWRCVSPPCKCDTTNYRQCAYATYVNSQPAARAGKCVPMEPTKEMVNAAVPYMRDCESALCMDSAEEAAVKIYKFMLSAAPSTDSAREGKT